MPERLPLPGSLVWYEPSAREPVDFARPPLGQPCAALVVAVWSPTLVNLAVFDARGFLHQRSSVYLKAGDGPPEYFGQPHARWPDAPV